MQERATAGIALTLEDYEKMGRAIASARAPTVFTQEGGYNLEKAGAIVRAVFSGMEAGFRQADPERGASAASIERDVLEDLKRSFPHRGYGGAKSPGAPEDSESSESSSESEEDAHTPARAETPRSARGAKSPKSPRTPREAAASPKSPETSANKAPTPAQAKKEPEKKKKRGWFG